jgi:perosamine synthetase
MTERAKYGAAAYREVGELPNPFPRTVGPNAMKYLQEIVDSGISCDMVGRFESAFAEAVGVKHCIATPGCTPALAALAAAFPFEPGDEIIVSPVTDYGTMQGLLSEHYIPVFADTAPGTVNMSAETIEPCITDRTRAILVVHMCGIIPDMNPINVLAARHGLIVYEDACQAIFGKYRGRYAGTLANAAAFSFDSEKTMGSDMGGCIVTDDDELAERVRLVGQSRGAEMKPGFGRLHTSLGYAYRMPLCTAAVTLAQLEIAPGQVTQRDQMIRLLTEMLSEIPGITPLPIPDWLDVFSCWMAGFSIDSTLFDCTAEEFAAELESAIPGIGQGKYYLIPEALTFMQNAAREKTYPFSIPTASHEYVYDETTCPVAHEYLENFIRWSTFCEKYEPAHCQLAANLIREVADKHRR